MQGWQKNRTNPDCNSWKVSSGDTGLKAILTLLLLSLVTDVLHLKQHSKRNLFLSNEYLFLWLRRESWWPHRKRVHCPGHCVVFLGKGHILMVPLSSQIYQWVLADEPIQGRFSKILLDLSCHRNQNWAPTYRLLGFKIDLFFFFIFQDVLMVHLTIKTTCGGVLQWRTWHVMYQPCTLTVSHCPLGHVHQKRNKQKNADIPMKWTDLALTGHRREKSATVFFNRCENLRGVVNVMGVLWVIGCMKIQ